jgi:hypothetical protein
VRICRANHKSMWQRFRVLRVKHQKASLSRRPGASTCGGVAWFSPNTSHVIRKRTVDPALAMGHQADPAHCYKFHILQMNLQYTIIFNIILGLGRWRIARIDSRW